MEDDSEQPEKKPPARNVEIPAFDPEHNLKKIREVFQVSTRIQDLVRARKQSPPQTSRQSDSKEQLVRIPFCVVGFSLLKLIFKQSLAKDRRADRLSQIATRERYVLDIAADLLNVDPEVLIEGVCDSDHYVELLESFFETDGAPLIVVGYQLLPAPGSESGRYSHKRRHDQIVNGFITDGDVPIKDRCVVAFRQNTAKGLEIATIPDVRIFSIS